MKLVMMTHFIIVVVISSCLYLIMSSNPVQKFFASEKVKNYDAESFWYGYKKGLRQGCVQVIYEDVAMDDSMPDSVYKKLDKLGCSLDRLYGPNWKTEKLPPHYYEK